MFDLDNLTVGEEEKLIQEGQEIEAMCKTEGWKLFEAAIDERIAYLKECLISSKDMNEIVRYQEAVKWGLALKNFIFIKISNAKILMDKETREDG